MSFYKVIDNELIDAPSVEGPGFELREETRQDHTYPVDGWYWYPNRLEALLGLQPWHALQMLSDTLGA